MLLDGKKAVITGGSSGIAAATVRTFAREGAAVVSVSRNRERGERVAREAAELGPGPITFKCLDVTKRTDVNLVFDEAADELGGFDVLAMVAGIAIQKKAEDYLEEDADQEFAVHGKGTIFTNQAAFRHMKATGGSIINYASFAGTDGMPGMGVYSAAKGAVLAWSRSVAKDWAQYGIRVNCVNPYVMTELAASWLAEMDDDRRAEIDAWSESYVPMGRYGEPEDAANLNVFLASDLSKFVTGQTIGVDGGLTITK